LVGRNGSTYLEKENPNLCSKLEMSSYTEAPSTKDMKFNEHLQMNKNEI